MLRSICIHCLLRQQVWMSPSHPEARDRFPGCLSSNFYPLFTTSTSCAKLLSRPCFRKQRSSNASPRSLLQALGLTLTQNLFSGHLATLDQKASPGTLNSVQLVGQ